MPDVHDVAVFLPNYFCHDGGRMRTDEHDDACGWIHWLTIDPFEDRERRYERTRYGNNTVCNGEYMLEIWRGMGTHHSNYAEVEAIYDLYLAGKYTGRASLYDTIMEHTGG